MSKSDDGSGALLDWSPELHQAEGMIAVQIGGSVSDAVDLLLGEAKATRRSVEDIARDVVTRRLRFIPASEAHEPAAGS